MAASAVASRESLKTKRQHLYSSIASALQQQHQQQPRRGAEALLLDQLQAVLEAEACLSCCEGDSSSGVEGAAPHHNPAPAAPAQAPAAAPPPHRQLARPPAAACAVQQLKEELAQRVHESVAQAQLQPEPGGRKTKVRALPADAEQHERDVKAYKRAADRAARLAEAASARAHACEQQLRQQAETTLQVGEELRCARQQMQQLHASVLQPLLRWHQGGAESSGGTADGASRSRRSNRHASAVTQREMKAAAAAVEQLMQQQQQRQGACAREREQEMLLQTVASLEQQLQATREELAHTQAELQELQQQMHTLSAQLSAARDDAAAAAQQVEQLQRQAADAAQQQQQAADTRVSWQAAAAHAATEQALAAAQQHEAHVKGLQDSCRQQVALQERQHLAAMLRCRQLLEEERQQRQAERDGLVQQLTAHYTAAGMHLQTDAAERSAQLSLQVQQLTQERDQLQQQLEAAGQQLRPRPGPWCPSVSPEARLAQPCHPAPDGSSRLRAGSPPPAAVAAGAPAAVQFSRALQAAEADRAAAIKRAAAAHAQLEKQEQELQHLQRAVSELRAAAAAERQAAMEAHASAAASSDAVAELTVQLEASKRQVADVQADATAELGAAQACLQLLRLKQQRLLLVGGCGLH